MANGMNRRVSYEEAQASPHNRINSYSHNDQQKQEKLQISPHFSLDDMIEAKQEAAQRQAEAQAEEMDKELEAYSLNISLVGWFILAEDPIPSRSIFSSSISFHSPCPKISRRHSFLRSSGIRAQASISLSNPF